MSSIRHSVGLRGKGGLFISLWRAGRRSRFFFCLGVRVMEYDQRPVGTGLTL